MVKSVEVFTHIISYNVNILYIRVECLLSKVGDERKDTAK